MSNDTTDDLYCAHAAIEGGAAELDAMARGELEWSPEADIHAFSRVSEGAILLGHLACDTARAR